MAQTSPRCQSLEFEDKVRPMEAPAGRVKQPEVKGTANDLKPQKLTTDIMSANVKWWVEQWSCFKIAFAFGFQTEAIKICYIRLMLPILARKAVLDKIFEKFTFNISV